MSKKNRFVTTIKKKFRSFLGRVEKISPVEVYVLIAVVAAVVFATRYFETQSRARLIRIELTTNEWQQSGDQYGFKSPFWLSDKLAVGQKERSPRGRILAEIIEMENYEKGNDQAEIYLVIRLTADYNQKSDQYSFKGRPLVVGGQIEFLFDNILVPGQILDHNYPPTGYDQGEFLITTRTEDVEPWFIDKIKLQQQMKNRATGEVIAELIDYRLEPSDTVLLSQVSSSNLLLSANPKLKDAVTTFKVKAFKQDGNWFFGGHQRLRVGSRIWIYLEDITFGGSVIEKLEYVSS